MGKSFDGSVGFEEEAWRTGLDPYDLTEGSDLSLNVLPFGDKLIIDFGKSVESIALTCPQVHELAQKLVAYLEKP